MNTVKKWIRSVVEFFREVKSEVIKVSFPTRGEVIGSATVVIMLALIVAIFLAFMDTVLMRIFSWVL